MKNIGIVLIHGFGGNPEEIEPLRNYLQNDYDVICPILAGHSSKKEMARSTYKDWVDSVDKEIEKLLERVDMVFVIGFSTGGLIGCHMSQKYNLSGLITMNTPIYHWDIKRIALNVVQGFKSGDHTKLKYYLDSTVKIPIRALVSFKKFLWLTKPMVKDIRCPLLIIQGMKDDTVNRKSAEYIFHHAQPRIKKIQYYQNLDHDICHGAESKDVFSHIKSFIKGA